MSDKKETQGQESTEEKQSLENFDWDDTGTGDFFGIEGTAVEKDPVKEVLEEVKKEEKEKEEQEQEPAEEQNEKKEEKDETFFEEAEEESKKVEEEAEDYYVDLTAKMKEKGIFQNIEIPEEEEITEDKFIEFQDREIEARVDEALEGFLEELDTDAAAFLKHKKDGGDTRAFFDVYSRSTTLPQGDLKEESYQEEINRYYYKNVEGLDSEDIDDKIEWLKDSGKLSKYAEKYDTKVKELDVKSKADLKKEAVDRQKLTDDNRQNFVDTIQESLDSIEEVGSFKFTPKVKKDLYPYITKATVKIGKNKFVTKMQAKLQETLRDPEKVLVLAKLLMTDFDVKDVIAATTTTQTKKLKKDMQRTKDKKLSSSGRVANTRRSLADHF